MNSKAEREWAILRTVYDVDAFASVKHRDAPDFELQHRHAARSFGVEITELYETPSDARAHNHPDYIGHLLSGAPHMHPDDERLLGVTTVSIEDQHGNLKSEGIPAIIRPVPTPREHYEAVAECVGRKNEKAATYLAELGHVNLIILDHIDAETPLHGEYSTDLVLPPALRAALLDTAFREVFLVSTTFDGEQFFRPLQMLMLMERFYVLLAAIDSFEWPVPLRPDDVVAVFAHVMAEAGMPVHIGDDGTGNVCALYRGAGIRHAGDGVRVLDFHDHTLPERLQDIPFPADAATFCMFCEHHALVDNENYLTTGMSMPVVRPAPLSW